MRDLFGPTSGQPYVTSMPLVGNALTNRPTSGVSATGGQPALTSGPDGIGVQGVRREVAAHPKKETRLQALRRERVRLLENEAEASQLVARAQVVQDPFEAAFQAAHQALLTADRARLTKSALFGLYDARLVAGHAWNKPRQKLRDAERWLRTIRSELLSINMELE